LAPEAGAEADFPLWEFPFDDGLVLVRPRNPGFYILNPTAALIWRDRSQNQSAVELASAFTTRFHIDPETARRDIENTLADWNQGMLAPCPAPHSLRSPVPSSAELRPVDCQVNGVAMRVFLDSGAIWDEIAPRLDPLRIPGGQDAIQFTVAASSGKVLVFRESQCIAREDLVTGARAVLLQAMVSREEPLAILHAGGCGGVLLAGGSYSGKSTLCAALMAGGLPYHCDDSAVLSHDFRVHPMPFPLALRQGSWALIEARSQAFRMAPRQARQGPEVRFLEPSNVSGPAAVGALVFVQYQDGSNTALTKLDTFDALLALQKSGFWVEHSESGIRQFLAWLEKIPKFQLQYSKLPDAEAAVRDLAAESAESRSAPSVIA
jgi:hypothetical protein